MNNNNTFFLPNRSNRRELKLSIPDLLFRRQQYGFQRTDELSGRIAWNTCRMQNMILSVGPGTPASVFMAKPREDSDRELDDENDDNENEDDEDDDDESVDQDLDDDNENDEDDDVSVDDSDEEQSDDVSANDREQETVGPSQALMDWMDSEGRESDSDDDQARQDAKGSFLPAMRHGGCINTACWLTTPWRLSLRGKDVESVDSQECPTQLITSGDDRLVKFWDVSYAMGTTSPLGGGKATITPFSSAAPTGPPVEEWKTRPEEWIMPGSVLPLAVLETRHNGNVFHVTPLDHSPGKVVTCAADGYLRMSDLESGTSSVVVSPEYDRDEVEAILSLRPGMCFSHHFLDANTGLLCSERGLRRFDLRTNPREQRSRSLLGNPRTCKACAIWSADDLDSSYVFCGGSSATVGLYDLRMTDSTGSRVVQKYLPRNLPASSAVSVSGLDISKDKRELLVSYENDQIYTFPIFPKNTSSPTVDELNDYASEYDTNAGTIQSDLASYGGHLNRLTFLKNAKYAGPNDEYICTGSDSGHAWIYARANGSVASFLHADHFTCNGIVPHPSLPFFITYGIDSTAKLWRASLPVDNEVDDSPLGRARFFNQLPYEKSPLVANWSYVEDLLGTLDEFEDKTWSILPDDIPLHDGGYESGIFSSLNSTFFENRRGNHGFGAPCIGNDLCNLQEVLRENLFACVRAFENGEDDPIRSSMGELKRRISVIRLSYHAARRGLLSKCSVPWILRARDKYVGKILVETSADVKSSSLSEVHYGDVVDLIPEHPSDWIPFDPEMTSRPRPCGFHINLDDYCHLPLSNYDVDTGVAIELPTVSRKWTSEDLSQKQIPDKLTKSNLRGVSSKEVSGNQTEAKALEIDCVEKLGSEPSAEPEFSNVCSKTERALNLLQETVEVLKAGGNTALKAGSVSLAARRYDLAIQYCAVAFMEFRNGEIDFLIANRREQDCNYQEMKWSPLLKLMITARLNLSMVLLNATCKEPKKAADQAMLALSQLGPFAYQRGEVRRKSKHLDVLYNNAEPDTTYEQAKELQAKAFFRLGSALLEIGEYKYAVKNFEASIKSTRQLDCEAKPEAILLRRLAEARRENEKRNKQQRKRFKAMFTQGLDESPPSQKPAKQKDTENDGSTVNGMASDIDASITENRESSDSAERGEFRFNFADT
jgi:tetratricopeptide (TPR) repeat protein